VDDGKKFDAAAVDVQIRQFSQFAIPVSVNADHQHPPVIRRVLQQQTNMGFDPADLASARIDRMNETKTPSGSSPAVVVWDLILHVVWDLISHYVGSRVAAIGSRNYRLNLAPAWKSLARR
jgi:hypothetical protein